MTTLTKANEWNTLNLGVRTFNALLSTDMVTIGDLTAKTADELLATKGVGPSAVDEISEALKIEGFTLHGDEQFRLDAIDADNNDASLGEFVGETFNTFNDAVSAADYLNEIHDGRCVVQVVAA